MPEGTPAVDQTSRLSVGESDIPPSGPGKFEEPADVPHFPYEPYDDVPPGYPKIDFKPIVLQSWYLFAILIFLFTCLGSVSAIVFLNHRSHATLHVRAQKGFLALRYLPGIIGTITTMWWRSIGAALFHMMPYISMAGAKAPSSISNAQRKRNILTSYSDFLFSTRGSTIYLLVKERNWLMLGIIFLQVALTLFLVPLKNVFVQLLPDDNGWTVSVSRIAASFLIAVYSLLITCTACLLLWLQDRQTGLKWDAACIADQIALIQGSNILESFCGLEFASRREATAVITNIGNSRGVLRLGYWRHMKRRNNFWHGISFLPFETDTKITSERDGMDSEGKTRVSPQIITAPQNTSRAVYGRVLHFRPFGFHPPRSRQRTDSDDSYLKPYPLTEAPLDWNGRTVSDPEYYRHRDIVPHHSDVAIAIYALLGGMALSGLVIIIIKRIIHRGFYFNVTTYIPHITYSPPGTLISLPHPNVEPLLKNFVFAFCPSLVMSLFSALWIVTDNFYRTVQPIAGMHEAAPASRSILLDYMQCPSIIAIPKAALNGHWRVAWFSLLALSANSGPIVAAGIFVGSPIGNGFAMSISPVNFWIILSLLTIYLISLPFTLPRPKHLLPRQILTIADLISYCYASKLVDHPMFSVQQSTDEHIHLVSKVHLAKQLYEFGLYQGKDGRRHLGVDVAGTTYRCDPGRSIHIFGVRVWLRLPKVLQGD